MPSLSTSIWNIADQRRGVYKPAHYGTATLPFILRRTECVLYGRSRSHQRHQRPRVQDPNNDVFAAKLRKQYKLHFWNRTDHTLKSLPGHPEN